MSQDTEAFERMRERTVRLSHAMGEMREQLQDATRQIHDLRTQLDHLEGKEHG